MPITTARFTLGQCKATQGALGALEDNHTFPIVYLKRHESGDWGDVSEIDKTANDLAIEKGRFIVSQYRLPDGQTIWITTDPDRSKTTILHTNEIWRRNDDDKNQG